MKLYVSLFLSTVTLPIAYLAGFIAFQAKLVWSLPQAFGIAAAVVIVLLTLALILFLWSTPSTMKRLKAAQI